MGLRSSCLRLIDWVGCGVGCLFGRRVLALGWHFGDSRLCTERVFVSWSHGPGKRLLH